MDADSIPACPVCYIGFHETKPAVLKCGHSICFECLRKILRLEEPARLCPECKAKVGLTHARDATVNYSLMSISDQLAKMAGLQPKRLRGANETLAPAEDFASGAVTARLAQLVHDSFGLNFDELTSRLEECGAALAGGAVLCAAVSTNIDRADAEKWAADTDLDIWVPARHRRLEPGEAIHFYLIEHGYSLMSVNSAKSNKFGYDRLANSVSKIRSYESNNEPYRRVQILNLKPFTGIPDWTGLEKVTWCDYAILKTVQEFDLDACAVFYQSNRCASMHPSGGVSRKLTVTPGSIRAQSVWEWPRTIRRIFKYAERGFHPDKALREALLLFAGELFWYESANAGELLWHLPANEIVTFRRCRLSEWIDRLEVCQPINERDAASSEHPFRRFSRTLSKVERSGYPGVQKIEVKNATTIEITISESDFVEAAVWSFSLEESTAAVKAAFARRM